MLRAQRKEPQAVVIASLLITLITLPHITSGCQFYPAGEYLKFVRVAENVRIGSDIVTLEVHPRSHLAIMAVDKEEDSRYFGWREVNKTHVSIVLAKSLEDVVDADAPRNLLKFRLACDHADGANSLVSSHLSVTVYVEDVNDHAPQFVDAPYHVTVDELSPAGLTIFRGIHAFDKDKPGTPNSDVHYAIIKGNEDGKFALESGHRTALVLKKPVDYDAGDREYNLLISANDRGSPAKSSNTTITITVVDNDDLDPKFTQDIYRTQIYEFYPVPSRSIHKEVDFATPIRAIDQDREIDVPMRYDIISGNDAGTFHLDPRNGSLFLERAIDLDAERNLPANTFVLQIRAVQIDNPAKLAFARVEVEVLDLNDNLPEFEVDFYNISIVENLPNGFSVLQVVAYDRDQGENGEFAYELRDPAGAFAVDPRTGWLTVQDQSVLDREKKSFLQMQVLAVERRPSVVKRSNGSSSVDVEVTLLDANDNNPVFVPNNLMEIVARSDFKVGTIVGQVHAVDKDLGSNGLVRYKLQRPGNVTGKIPFDVNADTGVISVAESPIQEGRHAIFIEAADQPSNPSERRFSLAVVTIDVFRPDSQGSRTPDFVGAPYEFWVGANVPVGTSVGQIRVNEAVKGKDVVYDLLHSYHEGVPFAVEERSGTITVVDEIEQFKRSNYDFEAVVTNERNLSLVTNVSIHVVDPNDDSGLFTKGTTKAPLTFHVRENAAGAFIGQVVPVNASSSVLKNVRFLIANQQDMSEIAITETGALYTPTGLDRERRKNYSITAIAESSRGIGIFQVIIIVDDEDDNAPIFSSSSYEGRIAENSPRDTEVTMQGSHVAARDPDEDSSVPFALRGDGSNLFRIDQITGRIFFAGNASQTLDREERAVYRLWIVAGYGKKKWSNASLTIHVDDENDNSPSFVQMVILPDQGIRVSKNDLSGTDLSPKRLNGSGRVDERSPLLHVPENVTVGAPIIRLIARDLDAAGNAEITYGILSEVLSASRSTSNGNFPVKRYFVMDSRSGEISVAGAPPAETDAVLEIVAKDGGGLLDRVVVKIHVFDVNDHAPVFKQSWYTFDVPEGTYKRLEIGRIEAADADHGANANLTYELLSTGDDRNVKFEISRYHGGFFVTGILDREARDLYNLKVLARDNGTVSLSATADVEIHVRDVNDNAPQFHGYQETSKMSNFLKADVAASSSRSATKRVPIYYASVPENSQAGTVVTKVYANDSDYAGNGNGLILYDMPYARGQAQHFAIDNKEGLITTIGSLDYETQSVHNLTIVASDLGSPSLTSTAMLIVRILDVDEGPEDPKRPAFQHRYYEVEVEENTAVPLRLLDLHAVAAGDDQQQQQQKQGAGGGGGHFRYSIVADQPGDAKQHFSLDPVNGSLYLLTSPDREQRGHYELKVRVDKIKIGRGMPIMIYPVEGERLNGLGPNEARVVLKVKDVNDNVPKFKTNGRPILAAISTTAHYGYNVIKVEAEDPDEGINGQVRYQILGGRAGGGGGEDSPKFAIDPVSGQVQTAASFAKDAGRVYGFDVKATDRAGAEDGRSSIANVFVYVLDHTKQLVMIMGKKPMEIEKEINNITSALKNITGLDIRVRKIEPHTEKNLIDISSSDMYLYAVDPNLNVMIDIDTLQNVFRSKKSEIKRELERYKVLDIAGSKARRAGQLHLLSTLEVAVVVLGCVVFVSALVIALCITCVRRSKRRQLYGSGGSVFHAPVGFALEPGGGTLQKSSSLFPSYMGGFHQYDPTASFSGEMRQNSFCEHEPNCVRFHSCSNTSLGLGDAATGAGGAAAAAPRGGGGNGKRSGASRRNHNNLETSATSLHSSGQDSGIVAGSSGPTRLCQCSNSSSPASSGESSKSVFYRPSSQNDYEDSLKSLHHQHHRHHHGQQQQQLQLVHRSRGGQDLRRGNNAAKGNNGKAKNPMLLSKKHRFHSFTNLESIYQAEPSSLQYESNGGGGGGRDRRYQTMLMDQKRQSGNAFNSSSAIYSIAHRRTFSEAENLNNITETVIQEHPPRQPRSLGSMGNLPAAISSSSSSSFLHGKGKAMIAAAANSSSAQHLRSADNVIYARPRCNFT
uniref:Cadherin domain-containing protein n=1 Tax=Trichogramma kaykai TaxID=54128 RepID=A0ABD2X656_9HYME